MPWPPSFAAVVPIIHTVMRERPGNARRFANNAPPWTNVLRFSSVMTPAPLAETSNAGGAAEALNEISPVAKDSRTLEAAGSAVHADKSWNLVRYGPWRGCLSSQMIGITIRQA